MVNITDKFRKNLIKYTKRAYEILELSSPPRILDIGCGTGLISIELARLSHGKITAIDIDYKSLEYFREKLEYLPEKKQIKILNRSMDKLDFQNEQFDIIWAEGSIQFMDFEQAIISWLKFLKPNGHLVLHDELKDIEKKKQKTQKK